ncbi:universal stress protein [Streptomyces griseoviridis]|uniref:Universal stress protein n=1 Tax=Streptomyces griseoviridis TaxID=45398 RepID=A0A3Q9KMA8_STRGD|nr:universal stress protein [Streptomyces griseoviridis]AZS84086.1 universal stress protein [Streptomyces griseoviridis]QCN89059.1 universal stress protein UspA [Streptomyces griseoviridis]
MGTDHDDTRCDGPVVVGVDGSPGAAAAVRWAAREAAERTVPLRVVCSVQDLARGARRLPGLGRPALETGRDLVAAAESGATRAEPGLSVRTSVSREPAPAALADAAGSTGTVVVGARGSGGFAGLMPGSVGLRTAARAHGPVVVVRGTVGVPSPAGENVSTGTVLVGGRDASDLDVLRFAARAARRRKSSVRLFSAWSMLENAGPSVTLLDGPRAIAAAEAAAVGRLTALLRAEFPGLTVAEDIVHTPSAAGSLVEASAHADLLVLGARRPRTAPGVALGPITHALLHHSHCPVAVVRHH